MIIRFRAAVWPFIRSGDACPPVTYRKSCSVRSRRLLRRQSASSAFRRIRATAFRAIFASTNPLNYATRWVRIKGNVHYEGLFTQKNPRTPPPLPPHKKKIRKKIQKIQGFFLFKFNPCTLFGSEQLLEFSV